MFFLDVFIINFLIILTILHLVKPGLRFGIAVVSTPLCLGNKASHFNENKTKKLGDGRNIYCTCTVYNIIFI